MLTQRLQGVSRSYVWGDGLKRNGAGSRGVGGSMAVNKHGRSAWIGFAAYDGKGNVAEWVDSSNGQWVVQYEYGPFGELFRTSDPQVKASPLRLSTKFQDDLLTVRVRVKLDTPSGKQ